MSMSLIRHQEIFYIEVAKQLHKYHLLTELEAMLQYYRHESIQTLKAWMRLKFNTCRLNVPPVE